VESIRVTGGGVRKFASTASGTQLMPLSEREGVFSRKSVTRRVGGEVGGWGVGTLELKQVLITTNKRREER